MEHGTDYANYPLYPEDFNDNIEEGYDYGDEDETAKNDTKHISRIKNSDQINHKPKGSTGK